MPKTKNLSAPQVQIAALCEYCKTRRKSGFYLFCGGECAAAASAQMKLGWALQFIAALYAVNPAWEAYSVMGYTQPGMTRLIGVNWNYHSVRRPELTAGGCMCCRTVPSTGIFALCARCGSYLAAHGPFILPVPQDHTAYWEVLNLFLNSWGRSTKNNKRPEVRMVYRIIPSLGVFDGFWEYRDMLEVEGRFSERGMRPGNEHLLWHGTFRACRLGEPGQYLLCSSPTCSLCSIARGSFSLAYTKRRSLDWFGLGIYTSSRSSNSDLYVNNQFTPPWKAVLLNSVLAGSVYATTGRTPYLTKPPRGFDSVYGKHLDHDELVVYAEDAIRPVYLVMYELV